MTTKKLCGYLQPLLDVTPTLLDDNQKFKRFCSMNDLKYGHKAAYTPIICKNSFNSKKYLDALPNRTL